jgi:probable phosphoglycerate mutase
MGYFNAKISVMETIHLLLARHGETLENQRHVLQGHLPGTLSPLGIQQAEQLAELLVEEPLDVIVCSDLARSYDTANAVAKRHCLIPQPTPLLREMNWGIYTGETLEDVDWYHLPAGVETVEQLYHRAGQFIAYLRENYSGKRILAVGHGAFNRAIQVWINGQPPFDMLELPIMSNATVERFEI